MYISTNLNTFVIIMIIYIHIYIVILMFQERLDLKNIHMMSIKQL